jgi:hypothetical protein
LPRDSQLVLTYVVGLVIVFFEFLQLVFEGIMLTAFMTLGRPRRSELAPRSPLDFLTGSELLLPGWTHPVSSPSFPGPSATRLAEVCRNRADRSTIGRPAGFEVPDGHQPACTSTSLAFNGKHTSVTARWYYSATFDRNPRVGMSGNPDWKFDCCGCSSIPASSLSLDRRSSAASGAKAGAMSLPG